MIAVLKVDTVNPITAIVGLERLQRHSSDSPKLRNSPAECQQIENRRILNNWPDICSKMSENDSNRNLRANESNKFDDGTPSVDNEKKLTPKWPVA
jgi:hypothetical protein